MKLFFSAFQPSLNSNVTFPVFTYCANVLGPRDVLKERIQFYAAFGFPAVSTFCFTLDSGHLTSLPGNLTSTQVRNLLFSPSPCTKATFDRNLKAFKLRKKNPSRRAYRSIPIPSSYQLLLRFC